MRRLAALAALALPALAACHKDGDAVLLIVVTASGSPPSITALEVKLSGPAGTSMNRYTHDGAEPIMFPTTLTAHLPGYATGSLAIDVTAEDASGTTVATGHDDAVAVHGGEQKTVYVRLACNGNPCVVDGGATDDGGGMNPPPACGNGRIDSHETCDIAIPAGQPGACPASCDDHVPCTRDVRTGSDCTIACAHTEITDVAQADGCCPAGETAKTDRDCPQTCDNGTVDPGETCDTAIPAGQPGACPTEADCTSPAPCVKTQLISAGTCSAVCVHYPVGAQNGDGCCPPDADNAADDDCPFACGNGVVEAKTGETCDVGIAPPRRGACPTSCDDGDSCTMDYFSAGGCRATCAHLQITAPISGDGCCPLEPMNPMNPMSPPKHFTSDKDTDCAPVCGNGIVERGETCDGDTSCPTSCPETPSACLKASVVGTKEGCDARCEISEVTTCSLQKDGCCPAGCTSDTDVDCAPLCGDGLVQSTRGEVCDTAVRPSDPGACPTSCPSKSCRDGRLVSAGTCAASCAYMPITSFRPGDGCCALASGANFTLDPDCASLCGNRVVESPAETCDFAIAGSCPGQDSCPPAMGCTRYVLKGSVGACTAACVATPITACAAGDQCCPAGCSPANDSDCAIICGDGAVEAGETCDHAITAGAAGACPRTCDDEDACTTDFASGSTEACTRTCVHQPITACLSDDGCCPPGCSAATDRDCAPHCGDKHVGAGETCDPPSTCPTRCPDDGDPCTAEQLTGSAADCTAACRHVPITACSGTYDGCCPTGCTGANDSDCL